MSHRPVPLCLIAKETGDVPLACLFNCQRQDDGCEAHMLALQRDEEACEWGGRQPPQATCRVCGSSDVRWRQQGGNWVLFSLLPGVEHKCNADDLLKDFE